MSNGTLQPGMSNVLEEWYEFIGQQHPQVLKVDLIGKQLHSKTPNTNTILIITLISVPDGLTRDSICQDDEPRLK